MSGQIELATSIANFISIMIPWLMNGWCNRNSEAVVLKVNIRGQRAGSTDRSIFL